MESYTYTSAHLGVLKKYRVMKILFLLLGCLVLLLQSLAWLVVWVKDMPVSTSSKVFVTITLVFSFFFIGSQFFFAMRNKNITKQVKEHGSFTTKRLKKGYANKASWSGGLVVLFRIIAIVFVILLAILTVSFIENYLNWGRIILKMPFMVLCTVQFLSLSAEFRYQTMLEKV
ncbi:MAG: hypothetical protein IJ358_00815 [Clostridia bacterium]|nr:hypothetical protein [Clostridia bacterium]